MPYKLSPFATFNTDPTSTIDSLKIILVIYTCYVVLVNYQSYSIKKIFSMSSIWENFTDLMIIFLQSYCFILKISDGDTFDIDPNNILNKSIRMNFQSLHFLARNFRDFCIMDTIGLIFILLKVVDGLRYN